MATITVIGYSDPFADPVAVPCWQRRAVYECGVCGCYHPWDWDGDCREDDNRFGSPEEYAEQCGVDPFNVEVRSMEDRLRADTGEYGERDAEAADDPAAELYADET